MLSTGAVTDLELMYVFCLFILLLFFWIVTIYISFAKHKLKNDLDALKLKTIQSLKNYDYDYCYNEEDSDEVISDYLRTKKRKAKLYKLIYEDMQERELKKTTSEEGIEYVEVYDVDTGEILKYPSNKEKE